MMGLECFLEVLSYEKQMIFYKHLAPQACFEIGLIYRRVNDYDQAKSWFKKAKQYNNYLTDGLINFRCEYVIGLMKHKQDKEKSQ